MKEYCVKYLINGTYEEPESIAVYAHNKAEAYDYAVYELIPDIEGKVPYSAWVYSVKYKSGRIQYFNTCDGLAY